MSDPTPRFPDHRGKATWGAQVVELERFRRVVRGQGRALDESARREAVRGFVKPGVDPTPVEGPYERIAVFGGVYSNHRALEALLEELSRRGAQAVFCLGDLGGFGPHPEKVWPLMRQGKVLGIQGNYEQALAGGEQDCNCGYTDPRDNRFAALSYAYTQANCSAAFKRWMGGLPARRRVRVADRELLLVHGSPRRINEFLFESSAPLPYLELLMAQNRCRGLLCTHTGLHWHRRLPSGSDAVNVGVIGRPANDGQTCVWYCMLETGKRGLDVRLLPLRYDYQGLAEEMRREELPAPFVETIVTGWWTSCLEVLPARERARSRF